MVSVKQTSFTKPANMDNSSVSLGAGKQNKPPVFVTQLGAFQPESEIAEATSSPPIIGVVKGAFIPTKNRLSNEQISPFSKENKGSFRS